MQTTLFDIPETPVINKKVISGEKCKNCIHTYNHYYGKMKYCEMQKDPRTSYGHKKIKANDVGCDLFEKI